ncbi:MAG: chemotaxis protein CheZ, partial [Hydrogenophaga sp.]
NDARLTEIMLAQDFHDLTGQVVARVVQVAATIEEQLLALLLESAPAGKPGQDHVLASAPLQGPVVDSEGRTDVVTNQAQVDDLLASLGF